MKAMVGGDEIEPPTPAMSTINGWDRSILLTGILLWTLVV